MKTWVSVSVVLATLYVLVAGCATPYQPSGIRGGYNDRFLGDDRFFIKIEGNAFLTPDMAEEYFFRRAQELTDKYKAKSYKVETMNPSWFTSAGSIARPEFSGIVVLQY